MVTKKRLRELVTTDREIGAEAQNATLRLMEHRWTAVQEIGSTREYARALGAGETTIRMYVRGWELWQEGAPGTPRTPNDVLQLAAVDAERREAMKIVADVKGRAIETVRKEHRPAVDLVLNAMRNEPDESKRIERGTQYAERVQASETARAEEHAARTRTAGRAYLTLQNKIYKAATSLRLALIDSRNVTLDSETVELLQDSLEQVRHLTDLLNLKLVGDTGVDWDTEVERILAAES